MPLVVVDTNVAIVANGNEATHADLNCQLACVERLESLVSCGTVAVDEGRLIEKEYSRYFCRSGRPGVGDVFFKFLMDFQYCMQRVHRVPISPSDDDSRGFEELPENTFDPSDRKFLAVAVVSGATVLNATDNDWHEQQELMNDLGVEVDQLCPQHACG